MLDFVLRNYHGMVNFKEFNFQFYEIRRMCLFRNFIKILYWDQHKEFIEFNSNDNAINSLKLIEEKVIRENKSYPSFAFYL